MAICSPNSTKAAEHTRPPGRKTAPLRSTDASLRPSKAYDSEKGYCINYILNLPLHLAACAGSAWKYCESMRGDGHDLIVEWSFDRVRWSSFGGRFNRPPPASAALAVAAGAAGHAAFDHAHVVLAAGWAGLAARRIEVDDLCLRVGFETHAFACKESDGDHVLFDHPADGGEDRRDVLALHPSPTARVEHRLEFLDHEGHVAAAPEHRRDHPRQGHGPGEMLHVLGVDEHLERPAMPADDDVVDRQVDRVFAVGPFQLVGRAFQFRGSVQRFGHIDDLAAILGHLRPCLAGGLVLGLRDTQHAAGHIIGPVGGAALAAGFIGLKVNILERLEGDIRRTVDRLGNRAVDPALRGGLYFHMILWRQCLRIHEVLG